MFKNDCTPRKRPYGRCSVFSTLSLVNIEDLANHVIPVGVFREELDQTKAVAVHGLGIFHVLGLKTQDKILETIIARGQIGLLEIPINDNLGIIAHARQKHFHLLRRRILRLVQYNKRILERTSPHVPQRTDFNLALLHQSFDFRGFHEFLHVIHNG